MDSVLKKEILEKFPKSNVIFDSSKEKMPHFNTLNDENGKEYCLPENYCPDLAFYDEKNVYCLITINPERIAEEFPYLIYMYPIRDHQDISAEELDSFLQKKYDKDTSKCLISLFFETWAKFSNFHHSKQNGNRPKGRLLKVLLVCKENSKNALENAFKELKLDYELIKTKNCFVYLIDGYAYHSQTSVMKSDLSEQLGELGKSKGKYEVYLHLPWRDCKKEVIFRQFSEKKENRL